MVLTSIVRRNKKTSFLAANTQDGFGEHWDKYPYSAAFFDIVGL